MNHWLWGQRFLSVGCVCVMSTHSRELMSWSPQRSSHSGWYYQWQSYWPCLSSHLIRAVSHQANCGMLECGHQRNKSTRCIPGKGGKRRRRRSGRGRVTHSVGCRGTLLLHVLTQHFHLSLTHSIKIGKQRLHGEDKSELMAITWHQFCPTLFSH